MIKNEKMIELGLEVVKEEFGEEKVERAIDAVKEFEVEVPTWIFGGFGGEGLVNILLLERPETSLKN